MQRPAGCPRRSEHAAPPIPRPTVQWSDGARYRLRDSAVTTLSTIWNVTVTSGLLVPGGLLQRRGRAGEARSPEPPRADLEADARAEHREGTAPGAQVAERVTGTPRDWCVLTPPVWLRSIKRVPREIVACRGSCPVETQLRDIAILVLIALLFVLTLQALWLTSERRRTRQ